MISQHKLPDFVIPDLTGFKARYQSDESIRTANAYAMICEPLE